MNNYLDILMQNNTFSNTSDDMNTQITDNIQNGGKKKTKKKVTIKKNMSRTEENTSADFTSGDTLLTDFTSGDTLLTDFTSGDTAKLNVMYKQMPTGGFPPIFVCTNNQLQNQEHQKVRQFASNKTAISMKEIMELRRDKPFISL
jgi:hypothetical protein